MSQQRALLLKSKQSQLNVESISLPRLAKDEILVKNVATALNPLDWKIWKLGILVQDYPTILGNEAAGIVEDVGENVTTFKKGDRVFYQGHFLDPSKATFQEFSVVAAELVAKLPENMTFEKAATLPVGVLSAAVGLYQSPERNGAGLVAPWENGEGKYKGKGILIVGGSSSVGQYVIQLARVSGFSQIAATASLHNSDHLKSLGATHIIERNSDIVLEAKKIFESPPEIVYDAVAEDTQEQALEILAPNGKLILVHVPHSTLKPVNKTILFIMGSAIMQRPFSIDLYANFTTLLASGKIIPSRVELLPGGLQAISAGLERLGQGKVSGRKLVVKLQETA